MSAIKNLVKTGNTRKFYESAEWRRKRKEALAIGHNECKICKDNGKYTKAECVHHIKEIKEYPELALSLSNLICLCNNCHNVVHEKILKLTKPTKRKFVNEERWE